jgi:hypothetical protein
MATITEKTKIDDEFVSKPKNVSWQRLWAFSGGPFRLEGWPSKNIHTDLEFAKNCGLPDKVSASATQYQGYIVQLMIDLFGVAWLHHGVMDVRFIAIVDAGDTLVSKATITSKEEQESSTKFTMDVSCENQRGQKVLVGIATGAVGSVISQNLDEYNQRLAELKTDSMVQQIPEGAPQPEPLEYLLTPELNQQFCYGEEDFHPRYIEETKLGPPIAHPALLLNWSNGTRSPSYSIASGRAGLHARDHTFFYNPARVGKKIRVTWKGIGTYERRGRPYSVSETLIMDEDGLEIIRRLNYSTTASQEYQVKT